jgi:hypothetical protein
MALSAEDDMQGLQHRVVRIAREMTRADAGTLYLVRQNETGERILTFAVAQNDSVAIAIGQHTLPIAPTSLAGFVAHSGRIVRLDDVYHLPPDAEFRHNLASDRRVGYRS